MITMIKMSFCLFVSLYIYVFAVKKDWIILMCVYKVINGYGTDNCFCFCCCFFFVKLVIVEVVVCWGLSSPSRIAAMSTLQAYYASRCSTKETNTQTTTNTYQYSIVFCCV